MNYVDGLGYVYIVRTGDFNISEERDMVRDVLYFSDINIFKTIAWLF